MTYFAIRHPVSRVSGIHFTPVARELTEAESEAVSGGHANEIYTGALTVAAGFVGVAAATVGAPVLAGAFALGSIGASAIAIYSALNDDDHNSSQ